MFRLLLLPFYQLLGLDNGAVVAKGEIGLVMAGVFVPGGRGVGS